MNTHINIIPIIIILFVHWYADAVLQTSDEATNKHKSLKHLLSHTFNYSWIWTVPICVCFGLSNNHETSFWYVINSLAFTFITFIAHTITDYFTSKLNTKLAIKARIDGDWHNFFVSVMFDQFLHYVQLFLTFLFLLNL